VGSTLTGRVLQVAVAAGAMVKSGDVLVRLESDELRATLARAVEPGQIVQPGRALFTLALAGPLQLVAQVDERYLEQLQAGQVASVLADAYPTQRFTARVFSIAPLVDAQRGAIEVKFSVAQPPAFLREDMTLSVEVETARREQALVVPADALRGDTSAGQSVWLVRDGRVQARAVRLGLRTLAAAEIVEGLSAGDVVLLGPAPQPGKRVRPDTAAALAASTGKGSKGSKEDAGAAMSNAMGR
jgi:HlyD family secretion protein